jgi:hypothetical protein
MVQTLLVVRGNFQAARTLDARSVALAQDPNCRDHPMTVRELIEFLKTIDEKLVVEIEGNYDGPLTPNDISIDIKTGHVILSHSE